MQFDWGSAAPATIAAALTLLTSPIISGLVSLVVERYYLQTPSASPGHTPSDLADLANYSCDLAQILVVAFVSPILAPASIPGSERYSTVMLAVLVAMEIAAFATFVVIVRKYGPTEYMDKGKLAIWKRRRSADVSEPSATPLAGGISVSWALLFVTACLLLSGVVAGFVGAGAAEAGPGASVAE